MLKNAERWPLPSPTGIVGQSCFALRRLINKTNFRERIVFGDFYKPSTVGTITEPVKIIDPVNAANNVSRLYTERQADAIVDAALEAGDAIDAALAAPTKQETVYYWQKAFGSSFQV